MTSFIQCDCTDLPILSAAPSQVIMPFLETNTLGHFNVHCHVQGGGPSGQAQARKRSSLLHAMQQIAAAMRVRTTSCHSTNNARTDPVTLYHTPGCPTRHFEGASGVQP